MIAEVLAPGVQDCGHADLPAQAALPELQQGLGGRVKEQVVERPAVLPDQRIERVREGEDQVEVGDGQ